MQREANPHHRFSVIVVGDQGVGKTSLLQQCISPFSRAPTVSSTQSDVLVVSVFFGAARSIAKIKFISSPPPLRNILFLLMDLRFR